MKPRILIACWIVTAKASAGVIPASPPQSSNDLQQRILADWQHQIDFYGKVVDQNSNPVAGAHITFHWMEIPDDAGSRSSNTVSNSQGLFSLHGAKGPSLSVLFSKEGYYSSRKGHMGFNYTLGPDPISPNPQNPIIFLLFKKGSGQSLVERSFPPGVGQIWQLHRDGTPINLDLINGSQATTGYGQLKMEFWRDASEKNARTFDWKLKLSVANGGLVATGREFAFEAPESGYQSSIVIDMPKTLQPWQSDLTAKYYLQLPDGKFGRIDLYLMPYNGVFKIHSVVNPSGSRNLEPATPQPQLPQGTQPGMTIVRPNFQ